MAPVRGSAAANPARFSRFILRPPVIGEMKIVLILLLSALVLGESDVWSLNMLIGCTTAILGFVGYSHARLSDSGRSSLPVIIRGVPGERHSVWCPVLRVSAAQLGPGPLQELHWLRGCSCRGWQSAGTQGHHAGFCCADMRAAGLAKAGASLCIVHIARPHRFLGIGYVGIVCIVVRPSALVLT